MDKNAMLMFLLCSTMRERCVCVCVTLRPVTCVVWVQKRGLVVKSHDEETVFLSLTVTKYLGSCGIAGTDTSETNASCRLGTSCTVS